MGRQSLIAPATSHPTIKAESCSPSIVRSREAHGVAIPKDPRVGTSGTSGFTRRSTSHLCVGNHVPSFEGLKTRKLLPLCPATRTNQVSRPGNWNRPPISDIRTSLKLPAGQIVAEQISLALCDQIAPPPSYDSLFGRTLPDTILAEEAKACLPSHSAQGVSCTVPNGVAPAPSSSHVQIKADPEENESVSMTLLCPEIQSCGSSSVGTAPEVEESKPVTPKSLLSLDSLDKKTLGSPPLASNLLFHTSAGLARPTSRPGLFYGSYGLPPDRNPYQIYGPLLQINRHNFSARSASTLSFARTTLLSLPSPLRLTTTTALALGPRTCSGSFNGGYGASGFQLNPNLSSNHNGPSGNSPLEDSGGVWSGQGPGHDSIDLENLQSQSDRRAHLESLAQEMGYRLVPAAYYDWIRALVARVFDLAPQPPVPLQTFSPPTPNTSAQFANYGPNLSSAVALPLALDDLLGPTFGGYDGLQHLIPFNYPPTVSHPQFVPRDAAPPTHPSPAIPYDISWGWLDNLEKTSQGLTGRAESESQPSVVTQLPESMSLPATESRAPYSIENTVDQVPDGRTLNRIEPDGNSVRQPPDATTLAACMAGPSSSAQDTPTDTSLEPRTTKQSAAATPQTGPIRTVKWAVCPFENCGKRFRRRYLLEAHLESYHKGKNAFPCVFPGCNKSYSLKTNMQRHYKSVHE